MMKITWRAGAGHRRSNIPRLCPQAAGSTVRFVSSNPAPDCPPGSGYRGDPLPAPLSGLPSVPPRNAELPLRPARSGDSPRGPSLIRGRRWRLLAAALVPVSVLGLGAGADRVAAFLFYSGSLDWVVGSEEAVRWAPDIWGPGAVLSWSIAAEPEWTTIFGSTRQFRSIVEAALAEAADIPTADIRWEVSGVTASSTGSWARDSSNEVFFHSAGANEWDGGAGLWFSRDSARGEWNITECDIGAPQSWADEEFDPEGARWRLRDWLRSCVGLRRGADPPATRWLRASESDDYYWSAEYYDHPWPDPRRTDRNAGLSLLRPNDGWLSTVGSVSGSLVTSEGRPVPYTHVWAFRMSGARDAIGAFSNRSGEFTIEGLEPGEYVLWAHPARYTEGLPRSVLGVKDAVLIHPVLVRPGRITPAVPITMRRGR